MISFVEWFLKSIEINSKKADGSMPAAVYLIRREVTKPKELFTDDCSLSPTGLKDLFVIADYFLRFDLIAF